MQRFASEGKYSLIMRRLYCVHILLSATNCCEQDPGWRKTYIKLLGSARSLYTGLASGLDTSLDRSLDRASEADEESVSQSWLDDLQTRKPGLDLVTIVRAVYALC